MGGLEGPPKPPKRSERPGCARALLYPQPLDPAGGCGGTLPT